MAVYIPIADSEIDPESPGTTTLFNKLRDNPLAMFEGAVGAPRLSPGALAASGDWIYAGDGSDGPVTYSVSQNIASGIYYHTTFQINAGVVLGVNETYNGYLVIRATEKITIIGELNLFGKGGRGGNGGSFPYLPGEVGGHGCAATGGGGGGTKTTSTAGSPGGNGYLFGEVVPGGLGGVAGNGVGGDGNPMTAAELKMLLAYGSIGVTNGVYKGGSGGGGGPGGDNGDNSGAHGGHGGGCVILIAPEIDFRTGAIINCAGSDATYLDINLAGRCGGSGGGLVVMAATTFTNNGTVNVAAGLSPNAITPGGNNTYAGEGADGQALIITL